MTRASGGPWALPHVRVPDDQFRPSLLVLNPVSQFDPLPGIPFRICTGVSHATCLQMRRKDWMKRRDLMLIVLFAGVAVQLSVATGRLRSLDFTVVPAPQLAVGNSVRALAGLAADGSSEQLVLADGGGTVTVLYAFHPDCAHSDTVAEEWARYFAGEHVGLPGTRRLAVTRDLPESASAYAERFGWDVELLSIPNLTPSDVKYSLVSRTPWVFVFDSDGVLRFHDHGGELERVEQAVQSIAEAT